MFQTIIICLLSFPVVVLAGGVSKWVDNKGVTHFGDRVPEWIEPQLVDIRPLTGGKGLSVKQLKLAKRLRKQEQRALRSKFKAEKKAMKRRKAE